MQCVGVGCERAAFIRADSGPFHCDEKMSVLSKKKKKKK